MSTLWREPKDPADEAWYGVDCAAFLDDDTLATAAFTVPDGLTKVAEAHTTTVARVKLAGGTAATRYNLTLDITTTGGQTFQRTLILPVAER